MVGGDQSRLPDPGHLRQNITTQVGQIRVSRWAMPEYRTHPRPSIGSLQADADLVPFGGGAASTRDLGLAYALVGLREQNSTDLERAFRRLQETVARGDGDALTLAYLAVFYRRRKDDAHALPLYEEAWRLDPTQSAVAAALGAYQMQRGNFDQAIRFWNQTLAISPALVLVRANLAAA